MANFCSNCGNALASPSRYCASCGQAVAGTAAPETLTVSGFNYPEHELQSEIVTQKQSEHEIPTIEFRNLHPHAVWLFAVSYVAKTSILLLLFAASILIALQVTAILLVVYGLGVYLAARVTYKNYEFAVNESGFRKVYGVFHKQTASIPFDRIQNISISRSLIDRMFGLAHLEIETAGTGGQVKKGITGGIFSTSEGYVPGVSPREAEDLKDLMLARVQKISP